jgi:sialidase-1
MTRVTLRLCSALVLACVALVHAEATEPKRERRNIPVAPAQLLGNAAPLGFDMMGPFANLPDGRVLAIEGNTARTSADEGKTWSEPEPLLPSGSELEVRPERALSVTRQGTAILVFLDNSNVVWRWDPSDPVLLQQNRADVWAVRSVDGGKTWIDLQMIQSGYCGAIRDMICTEDGRIIVTAQLLLPTMARHASITYRSVDEGRTWEASNLLDVRDAPGDHAGGFEPTIVEQRDHRFRLLIRTARKFFWQAWSADGLDWTGLEPTDIVAAHAPGLLKRLASGRQVLLWNALPGDRTLLHIAFSEDDGKTWSAPEEIARGKRVSYPYLLERHSGELWVTSMQGDLRAKVFEADYLKPR